MYSWIDLSSTYRIAGKFGEEFKLTNWRRQTQIANLFLTQSSDMHIRMMQYESAKKFLANFSFHDSYEQFAKFFARQIFLLYGIQPLIAA